MLLEMKNICKSFGEKRVLRDISISAGSGKAFGLLGRNGAGKTTSIRILMGVFPPDSGEILLDGKPIDHTKVKMGYLPEERGLYPKKIIFDQLIYFAMLKGMKRDDAEKSIMRLLSRLGMEEYALKRLDTLSKGNQQKIQLITAIAHDPDILILDEPFSGLDPVNAMLLKDVVKEEIAKGKIVLFSSHQMNYIEEFCDNIAILCDGKIALSGELGEIKRTYRRDRLEISSRDADKIIAFYGDAAKKNDDGNIVITLSSPDKKREAMTYLSEHFDIDGVRVCEPSLSDIFVEYAGAHI